MEIDRERGTGEIGYWVAREARGRGVATRAVRLVREWAASELGLTTLELVIHEDNAPSHGGRPRRRLRGDRRAARAAARGPARGPLRRAPVAPRGELEAGVEPADEAGHHARIDDVGHVGLAVDHLGAGGAGAVARVLAALDADDRVLRAVRDRDRQPGEAVESGARSPAPPGARRSSRGSRRDAGGRAEPQRPRHHRALREAAEHRALDRHPGALGEPLEPGLQAPEGGEERLGSGWPASSTAYQW